MLYWDNGKENGNYYLARKLLLLVTASAACPGGYGASNYGFVFSFAGGDGDGAWGCCWR